MSRRPLSLQEAAIWRDSENRATHSKLTGRTADIAESMALWKKIGDRSAIARTYLKEGDAAINADVTSARAAYEQALEICRSLSDVRCAAEAANNSGLAAQKSGDFEPAADRLAQAADDWRKLHKPTLAGITFSNIGLLYWNTNDFERAISMFDKALSMFTSHDTLETAPVLNNLGLCHQSLAQYITAGRYFEQALAMESAQSAGARAAVHARLNLGRNQMLQGRTASARRLLERAIADARALDYRPGLADALSNLGQDFLESGTPESAQPPLERALDLHRALANKRSEADDLHYLGVAAMTRGEAEIARSYFGEAIEIKRRYALREATTDSLFSLAVLDRDAGRLSEARDMAAEALGLLESVRSQVPGPDLRASYYARKRKFFDLLVQIEIAQGGRSTAEDGLLAAERGRARALLDTLAEGSVVHQIPKDLLERRASIQRQIGLLSFQLSQPSQGQELRLRGRIEGLVADGQAVEARIRETAGSPKLGVAITSVGQLREELLPHDSALIEYHLAEPCSYVWLVQPDSTEIFQLPSRAIVEAQSSRAIELFGRILDRKRSPVQQAALERAIRRLSQTLLGSFRDSRLPDRLIIVPDGILNQVPFAALQTSPANSRLGLTHDLIQIPAASFLEAGRKPRRVAEFPMAILGIADPVFSPDDPRVPPGAADRCATRFTSARLRFAAAAIYSGTRTCDSDGSRVQEANVTRIRCQFGERSPDAARRLRCPPLFNARADRRPHSGAIANRAFDGHARRPPRGWFPASLSSGGIPSERLDGRAVRLRYGAR